MSGARATHVRLSGHCTTAAHGGHWSPNRLCSAPSPSGTMITSRHPLYHAVSSGTVHTPDLIDLHQSGAVSTPRPLLPFDASKSSPTRARFRAAPRSYAKDGTQTVAGPGRALHAYRRRSAELHRRRAPPPFAPFWGGQAPWAGGGGRCEGFTPTAPYASETDVKISRGRAVGLCRAARAPHTTRHAHTQDII